MTAVLPEPSMRGRVTRWGVAAAMTFAVLATAVLAWSLASGVPRQRRAAALEAEVRRLSNPGATTRPAAAKGVEDPRLKRIATRNLMGAPKPPMGQLTGVLGDAAIFNNAQLVRVGESFMGAKVVSVGASWAEVQSDGQVQKLYVFPPVGGGPAPAPISRAGPPAGAVPGATAPPRVPTPPNVSSPPPTDAGIKPVIPPATGPRPPADRSEKSERIPGGKPA